MNHKWRKLGLIYSPIGTPRHTKLFSHAANPLAIHIEDDVFRIFYSGRDQYNRSSVGAVDINIIERKILHEHFSPFFEYGPKESFYADGVSIGNCYEVNGVRYILFMGWQCHEGRHWRGDIGRLILQKDLTLELDSEIPFMGSDHVDPISLSYPWVLKHADEEYSMWYGSTLSWDAGNEEMLHVINYAVSKDGHNWEREGLAIPYELGKAQAFSRPTVARNSFGDYEMWFSYRSGNGEKYRIGNALSKDRKNWELLLDKTNIDLSLGGWDSDMIEYPFVFDHKDQRYMLYNGNDYGKTGFGLAIMETY